MPGMNGTGPMGQGPLTGRGMGFCNPKNPAVREDGQGYGFGRGMGMGQGLGRGPAGGLGRGARRGLGRGFGFNCYNYGVREDNLTDRKYLEQRQSILETQLDNIKKRRASLSQDEQE
jgi:hypothetical protein